MIPLLLVLGLVLGPAYYGYCVYLSGETAQSIPMTERDKRWVLPDGSILRFHNSLGYKPVPLDLKPEMNLVALRLVLEFPDGDGDARNAPPVQYQATLQQPGNAALERTIRIDAGSGRRTGDFGTVEIGFAGQYLFLLEEVGAPAATPRLALEVRQNIETPNRYVVWLGMTLLIVALVLQIHWLVRARKGTLPLN
jgi:hypothetical protein